jgi:hypothetical protein
MYPRAWPLELSTAGGAGFRIRALQYPRYPRLRELVELNGRLFPSGHRGRRGRAKRRRRRVLAGRSCATWGRLHCSQNPEWNDGRAGQGDAVGEVSLVVARRAMEPKSQSCYSPDHHKVPARLHVAGKPPDVGRKRLKQAPRRKPGRLWFVWRDKSRADGR